MSLPTEDSAKETAGAELVHWMEPGPIRFEPRGVVVTAAAAFAAGAVMALGALAAVRWVAPRREGLPPWKWRRGPLH